VTSSRSNPVIAFPREWSAAELVAGLRDRDPAAGRVFLDRYAKRMHRLVWRLLGACSEHDDLVQQVFLNAFSGIEKLREPERLESWLVSLAVNTVRKELRGRKVRRFFVVLGLAEDRLSPDLDPETQAAAAEMYRVLGQVHDEDRLVFVLCMVEGMTQAEAAEACGMSLSTCKRRLVRACERASRLARDVRRVSAGRAGEGSS